MVELDGVPVQLATINHMYYTIAFMHAITVNIVVLHHCVAQFGYIRIISSHLIRQYLIGPLGI